MTDLRDNVSQWLNLVREKEELNKEIGTKQDRIDEIYLDINEACSEIQGTISNKAVVFDDCVVIINTHGDLIKYERES